MKKNAERSLLIQLNKFIASTGYCSRRQAADLIKKGLVKVNGIIVKTPYTKVSASDFVSVKNKKLSVDQKVYVLLNKPKDYVTTVADERGRKTVVDLVKSLTKKRVYPVGRLDRTTTGLILLTNDGELTQKLSHPKYEIKKVYTVVLDAPLNVEHIQQLKVGVNLKDGRTVVDAISIVPYSKRKKIKVQLHSGKNRIVRRLFHYFDYTVVRLDRINYAGLTKRGLPLGKARFLTRKEIDSLKGNADAAKTDKKTKRDYKTKKTRR